MGCRLQRDLALLQALKDTAEAFIPSPACTSHSLSLHFYELARNIVSLLYHSGMYTLQQRARAFIIKMEKNAKEKSIMRFL